jgi:hypothetical protein
VAEFDLYPVLAAPGGAGVLAARIRAGPAQPGDPFLRQLRLSGADGSIVDIGGGARDAGVSWRGAAPPEVPE